MFLRSGKKLYVSKSVFVKFGVPKLRCFLYYGAGQLLTLQSGSLDVEVIQSWPITFSIANAEGLLTGASALSRPAEEYENDETVEAMWAIKAFEHAEIYFNILCSVDPRLLRLTPNDDAIYKAFREEFPNMSVKVLNEDEMKSPSGKEKWRPFCEKFKSTVEDYSFGTLIRIDSEGEYSEENSMLTTRIQFYAIELSRNREGCNDGVRIKYKPSKKKKQS